jgi:hypothetical protein
MMQNPPRDRQNDSSELEQQGVNRGRSEEEDVAQQHPASPFPVEGVGTGSGDLCQPGLP